MSTVNLWTTASETLQAFGTHYVPAMDKAAAELGLPEWYGLLLPALMFEPEPISAKRLGVRSPYTSPRLYNERLAEAARQGLLVQVAEGENAYRLTEKGRQAAKSVIDAAYVKMAALQPISSDELERLANLLHRLVMSCLAAPEPPGKWCITHSRRIDPGDKSFVLARIDQYLSDLGAYRDDAHLASWQSQHIEGHVWEAFTYLWRGEASTLDGLVQKLTRRGHSQDEYRQALEELTKRGWVVEEMKEHQVTTLGKEIRQEAEETTDQYFYAPWSCLTQEEMEELRSLLVDLRGGL